MGLEFNEASRPDHWRTVSRTRRLIDIGETHQAVFTWSVAATRCGRISVKGEDGGRDRDRRDDARSQRGAAQYRAA